MKANIKHIVTILLDNAFSYTSLGEEYMNFYTYHLLLFEHTAILLY